MRTHRYEIVGDELQLGQLAVVLISLMANHDIEGYTFTQKKDASIELVIALPYLKDADRRAELEDERRILDEIEKSGCTISSFYG